MNHNVYFSHAFECMVISYVGMVCATAACFSCAVDGELHVGRCCKLDKAGGARSESALSL